MHLTALSKPVENKIKTAIWLYFFLWIFEGALRKWILPGLATPLLVIRDPVAIYIIYWAVNARMKFTNNYVVYAWFSSIFCLSYTIMFGHGNLFVGLYGARIMLLHFPLIFIIGDVFGKEDVLKLGRVLLGINILMTILVYYQFSSPQTAFVNIGIGGEGSAGFSGAKGYSRPPGTFSFISGLSIFYAGVSVFVFYFWLSKDSYSKLFLIISTIALIIALPLTISRSAVVGVLVVGLFAIIGSGTNGKSLFKLVTTVIFLFLCIIILKNNTEIFKLGTEVFMSRVDAANQGESIKESVVLRGYNEFMDPLINLFNQPLFAGNLGMGTNAGSKLLTGKTTFLISEGELGRLGGEQGLIFGGCTIALRLLLAIGLALRSWSLPQDQRLLPFLLCGAACIAIAQGQWAQPSVLGFGILMGGLVVACLKTK